MASKKASVKVGAAPCSQYGKQLTTLAITQDIVTEAKASRIPILDISAPLAAASSTTPIITPAEADFAKAIESAPLLIMAYVRGTAIHAEMTNVRKPRNLRTTSTLKALRLRA
jgi:hypothetical protein